MYKGSPNDFSCDKADWVPYLLYSCAIEYGGLFSCFIRYIAGIYVLRQRRQLVIEFILAQCLLLKGTHNKSNQLLSALIYSWNSFAFPAGLGHGYASLAIKHLPHWPPHLLGSFATQNTHRVSVAEGVAFAICYASFFLLSFLLLPCG